MINKNQNKEKEQELQKMNQTQIIRDNIRRDGAKIRKTIRNAT